MPRTKVPKKSRTSCSKVSGDGRIIEHAHVMETPFIHSVSKTTASQYAQRMQQLAQAYHNFVKDTGTNRSDDDTLKRA